MPQVSDLSYADVRLPAMEVCAHDPSIRLPPIKDIISDSSHGFRAYPQQSHELTARSVD